MSYIPHLELILTKAKQYNTIIVSAPNGYNQLSLINGILNFYKVDSNKNFINSPKLALIKDLEVLTTTELDEANTIIDNKSKLLIAFTTPFNEYLLDYTNSDSVCIITESNLNWGTTEINKLKSIYNIQINFPDFLGGFPLACSTFIKIYSLYSKQDHISLLENFGQKFVLSKFKDTPNTLLTTLILFSNNESVSIDDCSLLSGLSKPQIMTFVNHLITVGILVKNNTKIQPIPFVLYILSTMINSPMVNWTLQKKIAYNLDFQDITKLTQINKNVVIFFCHIPQILHLSLEQFNYQWILDSLNKIPKYELITDKKLQMLKAIILLDFCNNFKDTANIIHNIDIDNANYKNDDDIVFFNIARIKIYIYQNRFIEAERLINEINNNNNYHIEFKITNKLLQSYVYIYKNNIKEALNILNNILIKAETYQMYKVKIEALYLIIRIYYYLGHIEPAKKIVNTAIKYSRSRNAGSEICTSQIYFIGGLIYLMTGYTNEANRLITYGNSIVSQKTSNSSLPFMCIQLLQFIINGINNSELQKTLYNIYSEKNLNSPPNIYNIHNSVFEITAVITEYRLGNFDYLQNKFYQSSLKENIQNYNDLLENLIYFILATLLKKDTNFQSIENNIKYCEDNSHIMFLLRFKLLLIILFPNKYNHNQQIEIITQIINCGLFIYLQIFEPYIRHLLTIILTNKNTPAKTKELLRNIITGAYHFQPQADDSNYQELLTPKEKQISLQILSRKSNEEIAKDLFMSKATLRNHINHIYKKLNVKNRTEVVDILSKINLSN